jgi:hypothetical protein
VNVSEAAPGQTAALDDAATTTVEASVVSFWETLALAMTESLFRHLSLVVAINPMLYMPLTRLNEALHMTVIGSLFACRIVLGMSTAAAAAAAAAATTSQDASGT